MAGFYVALKPAKGAPYFCGTTRWLQGGCNEEKNNKQQHRSSPPPFWSAYCSTMIDPQYFAIALPPHPPSLSILGAFPSLLPHCSPAPLPFFFRSIPTPHSSCHGCHFMEPTHLLQTAVAGGALTKGQRAPAENRQPLTPCMSFKYIATSKQIYFYWCKLVSSSRHTQMQNFYMSPRYRHNPIYLFVSYLIQISI